MYKRFFSQGHFSAQNRLKLLNSGQEYFTHLFRCIDEARHIIHIQAYIFEYDNTGKALMQKLEAAVARGVAVFLLFDGIGSDTIDEAFADTWRKKGLHIRLFSPLFASEKVHFGLRLHHKICVIDSTRVFVSGINLSDRYSGFHNQLPWLDFAIYGEGKLAQDAQLICERVWNKGMGKRFQFKDYHKEILAALPDSTLQEVASARLNQNDWLRGRLSITRSYRQAMRHSERSLLLFASYFLPGNRLRHLLKKSARKGVKIRLVLSHKSDVGIAARASRFFYRDFLKADIELYEWLPSVLHAKVAIYDEAWMTVGSYNLNTLSDYGSIECNVEIRDPSFVAGCNEHFQQLIATQCRKIEMEELLRRQGFVSLVFDWASYQISRLLIYLLFYLQKQDYKKFL